MSNAALTFQECPVTLETFVRCWHCCTTVQHVCLVLGITRFEAFALFNRAWGAGYRLPEHRLVGDERLFTSVEFAAVWQTSQSLRDAAGKLDISERHALRWYRWLRSDGVRLKTLGTAR